MYGKCVNQDFSLTTQRARHLSTEKCKVCIHHTKHPFSGLLLRCNFQRTWCLMRYFEGRN